MPTLEWLGKSEAVRTAQSVPHRLLEPVPELSYGDLDTDNMLIQGDNLEALKSLIPLYAGKVKCIFIDPPYNTRSAFEHYDDNLEHSKWLSMIYPRLELLRELLSENGSIWISIDDREAHYLKVISDDIFGRSNFINDLAWRAADSSNNDAKQFSLDHNSILVYSKSIGWLSNALERKEQDNSHYKNPDNDPRGPWFSGNISSPNPRENLKYPVVAPDGNVISSPTNGWRWSRERIKQLIDSNEIVFSQENKRIIKKTYLSNQKGLAPSTIWSDVHDTGHNRQAK